MMALRKTHALTLDQLAAATGFTKGYLSKVENGLKTPPIASLARIAAALGANINEFFANKEDVSPTPPVLVVKVAERQSVVRGGTQFGYDYESIAFKRPGKRMEPFVFRFPKQGALDVFFEHDGEEMIFVLTGRVHFEIGSPDQLTRWRLDPGDCAYFDSRVPHRGYAIDGEATALVVIASDP